MISIVLCAKMLDLFQKMPAKVKNQTVKNQAWFKKVENENWVGEAFASPTQFCIGGSG